MMLLSSGKIEMYGDTEQVRRELQQRLAAKDEAKAGAPPVRMVAPVSEQHG